MLNRYIRVLMSGLLCLCVAGAAACGDDDGGGSGTNNANNSNNANNNPANECADKTDCEPGQVCLNGQCAGEALECSADTEETDCDEGQICSDDNTCVAGCRDSSTCAGDLVCISGSCGCKTADNCSGDEVCQDGSCQPPKPPQCANAPVTGSVACDPEAPIADGYQCLNAGDGPQCFVECEPPPTGDDICVEDTVSDCQSGTFCLDQQGAPHVCLTSQCDGLTDTEGCDDEIANSPSDFPSGTALCLSRGNGAFTCTPAGDLSAGEVCQDIGTCGSGLICAEPFGLPQIGSVCTPFCNDDSDCSGNQRCIGDGAGLLSGSSAGVCGQGAGCEAFGPADQCGAGMACSPLRGDDGLCAPTGSIPVYAECDAPVECESGADCAAGEQCTDDGVCAPEPDPCETSDDCPNGEACTDDGVCDIQPSPQCADGSACVTLSSGDIGEAGEARCLPLCDTSGDAPQSSMDASCPGGGGSAAFGQFINLAAGQGAVDVYVNDNRVVDDRSEATGNAGPISRSFIDLPVGSFTIDVVAGAAADNSSPLASFRTTTGLNDQLTFALIDTSDGLELIEVEVPRDVPMPASGMGQFRVAVDTEFANNIDVYVSADGATVDSSAMPEATDLGKGDTTGYVSAMAAGGYDVHLYPTGDTPSASNEIATLDVSVADGDRSTVHVWGDPPSAVVVGYGEARETTAGAFCLDQGRSTGICFPRCGGSDDFGQGACPVSGDVCSRFRGENVCWASQQIPVGQPCPTDAVAPCEGGAFCRAYGDGSGKCASYCQPDSQTNPALGCDAAETCRPVVDSDNLGECSFACQPNSFPSELVGSSCPDNLKHCLPVRTDEQGNPELDAYCSATGSVLVGEACDSVATQNCAPGGVCRREISTVQCSVTPDRSSLNKVLFGPVGAFGSTEGGQCRQTCELFAGDCPDGQACMIDARSGSAEVGFCMPAAPELSDHEANDTCDYEFNGKMCGDGAVCTALGGGTSQCLQFCNLQTGDPCGVDLECTPFLGDNIGLCSSSN